MEIVIKISKEDFEYIKNSKDANFNAIKNGIPLQKIKDEIEQIGAYYQEVGEQERANAFLEVLSIIDKCKAEKECKYCEHFDLSTNKCLITGEKCYENKECSQQDCKNYKDAEWCSN